MTTPVQTPINRYLYAGSPVFAFTYLLDDASDLLVTVNGVAKILGSDYTVAGLGNFSGGAVTYLSALNLGDAVALIRNVALQRLVDYQDAGDFLADTVNMDFDRLWQALQDTFSTFDTRSLRAPDGEIFADLPPAAQRANNLLGFDPTTGLPVLVPTIAQSASALALTYAGASGSAQIGFTQIGSGAILEHVQDKLREQMVSVKDFGAVGDGVTDDTAAFQLAIAAAGIGRNIFVPRGKYKITAQLALLQGQKFIGESKRTAFKNGLDAQLSTLEIYVGQGGTTTAAILLDLGSGIDGICMSWPNQVAATVSTPIQFGWAVATDTTKSYNIDDVTIRDLMLTNAYMGVSMDKAGRFEISGVYGDCISEGLFVDRCFDVSRVQNFHVWPFTFAQGSALGTWIQANGRCFNLNRGDDVKLVNCFGFGRNVGFDFNDAGNGGFWGDLFGCTADTCNIPQRISKMVRLSQHGGALIPIAAMGQVGLTTSSDISEAGQGDPFITFAGVCFHTNARVGAIITSSTGSFAFNGCDFEMGASSTSCDVAIINESTAKVSISSPKTRFGTLSRLTILGDGANTRWDGVPNPACSTDVTPANLGMGSFTSGIPDNWAFIVGTAANIANQGGGFVRLLLNSASALSLRYVLPGAVTVRRSLFMLRVLVRYFGTTNAILSVYARRSDTTNIQSLRRFNGFCHGQAVFYNIPLLWGFDSGAQSLDFEWSTPSGAGSGYIEIAGLQLFECADAAMQQDVIDSIHRRDFLDPYGLGPAISKIGGNRQIEDAIGPPTAGTWRINDRVRRNPAVVGQPKAWTRITAGSGNVFNTDWISEGNL